MKSRLTSVVALSILAACTSTDEAPDTFRAVFIADTHVIGPQYECCSESPGIDNTSIVKTEARLKAVIQRINAIQPAPDMVFVLGDVVHNPYYSTDMGWYSSERTAFTVIREALSELSIPLHVVWGNHDYDVSCSDGPYVSREFSHQVFAEQLGYDPYYSVDHKGWKFILGNSMLGPTWEYGHELCDTGLASYGREQLAWMDDQLAEGKPTTWMAHYSFIVTQDDEDPMGPVADAKSLLSSYADRNLAGTFVGHTHRWMDFGADYPFDHYVVAATRYDADNFWLVEFDSGKGTYEILDYDKGYRFSTCSEQWVYDGVPHYDPNQPLEDGDC